MTETARMVISAARTAHKPRVILAPVASGEGGLSVAANGCLVTEISASDLNGDVLSYAPPSAPAGASIDSMTGL